MTNLACTACIDLGFQYNYPYFGYALAISLIWFGYDAFRPTSDTSTRRSLLIFWAFALATIWFTVCMIPMFWGGFTGVVTGVLTLKALLSAQTPRPRRQLAGLALAGLVILAVSSVWTYSRLEHHIAWLGRLPPHSATNRRPAHFIRSAEDRSAPLLVQAAERELTNEGYPKWIRLGALSREIARLNRPAMAAIMIRFRDLAVQTSQARDGFVVGLDTTILACGEASSCNLTSEFAHLVENRHQARKDYEALIFATALGLSDRETAIQWRAAHPLNETEGQWFGSIRQTEALELLWEELKKGPVPPEFIQKQLDVFPPTLVD